MRFTTLLPRLIAVAALPVAASCAPQAAVAPMPAQVSPVEVQRFNESVLGNLRSVASVRDPVKRVFRSEAAWNEFWSSSEKPFGRAIEVPYVDFSQHMVLLAAMGSQGSGGFSIRIEGVADSGSELVAYVVRTSPAPSCYTAAVVTYPVDLVRVPRSEKPVRWSFLDTLRHCETTEVTLTSLPCS